MKKIKFLLLLIIALFSIESTFAQGGTTGPLTWVINNGTLTITGEGEMPDYDWYNDVPWFTYRDTIISIILENGVTTIGNYAFSGFSNLISVEMPSILSIGNMAFDDCYNLLSLEMPSVITIEKDAFFYCRSLSIIDIPNAKTIKGSAFRRCDNLVSVNMPSVINIEELAFFLCERLVSVDIPSTTTNIGEGVFAGCSNLTTINVNSNNSEYVSEDGILFNRSKTELLQYPAGIKDTSYIIPNTVKTIGGFAFYGVAEIVHFDMPNVEIIGNWAFVACHGLTSVNIPNVIKVGELAFGSCINLVSVNMENVTIIKKSAFLNCFNLLSIDIPNVISVEQGTFFDCAKISTVNIPNATIVKDNAFYCCYNLTSVNMPNVITIEHSAFQVCLNLNSVMIPDKTTSIGHMSFAKCKGLKQIISQNTTPPDATYYSFYEVPVNTCILYVPTGSKEAYSKADGWKEFINIVEGYIINDKVINTLFTIYPNPVSKLLTIHRSNSEKAKVEIYNLNGSLVKVFETNSEKTEINVSEFSSGVYFIRLVDGNGKMDVEKIIKF